MQNEPVTKILCEFHVYGDYLEDKRYIEGCEWKILFCDNEESKFLELRYKEQNDKLVRSDWRIKRIFCSPEHITQISRWLRE